MDPHEDDDKRLTKSGADRSVVDVAKARTRDSTRAFKKLTHRVDGELRFVADPPLIVPLEDLVLSDRDRHQTERSLRKLLKRYRRTLADEHHPLEEFRYVDMARKVVGVGSVGTRAWIFLMTGVDEQDPLILQAKEAQPSVLERFAGRSAYDNQGQRVVVDSDRCRRPATSSWAGNGSRTATAITATTTSGSSTTGRARPTWTRCG